MVDASKIGGPNRDRKILKTFGRVIECVKSHGKCVKCVKTHGKIEKWSWMGFAYMGTLRAR